LNKNIKNLLFNKNNFGHHWNELRERKFFLEILLFLLASGKKPLGALKVYKSSGNLSIRKLERD